MTDEIQKTTDPRLKGLEKARAARAANRAKAAAAQEIDPQAPLEDGNAPAQQSVHQPTRTPTRTLARGEVLGRNGEVLSRKRTVAGDIFDIPQSMIPKDYEYQWCAVSVVGNTEILLDQNLMFAENGWRPVPASRHEGRFMPVGHKGSIVRGGQMLMERPKSLSDEARAEDVRTAKQLISDRNESLKLSGVRKAMPDGFEMNSRYRGTGGDVRLSIDKGLDLPAAPSHTLADPGE